MVFLQHKVDRGQPREVGEVQQRDLDIGDPIAIDIPHDNDFGARALYPQLTPGAGEWRRADESKSLIARPGLGVNGAQIDLVYTRGGSTSIEVGDLVATCAGRTVARGS